MYLRSSSADTFTPKDAFVGYQYDTPASVVFKVWQDLRLDDAEPSGQWEEKVFVSTCIANYCIRMCRLLFKCEA